MRYQYKYYVLVPGLKTQHTDSLFTAGVLAGCDAEWDHSHRKMISKLFGSYKNYADMPNKSTFTLRFEGNLIIRT